MIHTAVRFSATPLQGSASLDKVTWSHYVPIREDDTPSLVHNESSSIAVSRALPIEGAAGANPEDYDRRNHAL